MADGADPSPLFLRQHVNDRLQSKFVVGERQFFHFLAHRHCQTLAVNDIARKRAWIYTTRMLLIILFFVDVETFFT